MDLGRAFSFVTEDENWMKSILIGGLVFLIPIVGPILLMGYMIQTARNVVQGNPRPLPQWDDFGEKLRLGLHVFVIQIVYALPVLLLGGVVSCITAAIGGASGSEEGAGLAGLVSMCLFPLIFVVMIATYPMICAALARYAYTSDLGTSLRLGETVALVRQRPGPWLMLVLAYLLSGFVASLGMIALFIGMIFTMAYSQAMFGHAVGQTALSQFGSASVAPYNQQPPPPPSYTTM